MDVLRTIEDVKCLKNLIGRPKRFQNCPLRVNHLLIKPLKRMTQEDENGSAEAVSFDEADETPLRRLSVN